MKYIRVKDEDRHALEFAYTFLVGFNRDESRGYWTKVGVILTVNSILLAGFAVLYGKPDATPLLFAMAASGFIFTGVLFFVSWHAKRNFDAVGGQITKTKGLIQQYYKRYDINLRHEELMKGDKGRMKWARWGVAFALVFVFIGIWITALVILYFN